MTDLQTITTRAVHDALAIRGLEDGGGGFIRTTEPVDYMNADRLRLAREVLRHLPTGASTSNADQIAAKLMPLVSKMIQSTGTDHAEPAPGRIMFLS